MTDIRQRFREDGYIVANQVLSRSRAQAARAAYETLVMDLATISAAELSGESRRLASPEAALTYLIEHHPLLVCSYFRAPEAVHSIWYRKPDFLPSFYLPEAFAIATDPGILDIVQSLLDTTEISLSPIFYCNVKCATQSLGQGTVLPLDFLFGPTHIHCDMQVAREETFANQIVNVWVPLTEARSTNGTLCVIPGSHASGPYPFDLFRKYGWKGDETTLNPQELLATFEAERRSRLLEQAIPVEVSPGDAVILDYSLYHGSFPFDQATRSPEMRWALNFRFFRTGTPCGLVGLPSFPVRSASPETVIPGPFVWSAAMERAIRNQLNAPQAIATPSTQRTTEASSGGLPTSFPEWLQVGRDQRSKARSFVTPKDKEISIRVLAGGAEVFSGPTSEISFGGIKAACGALAVSGGDIVTIEISSPAGACTVKGRAFLQNDALWIDLLDLPLAEYPSRTEQGRYYQILTYAGETLPLMNLRNLPLVKRQG